MSEQNGSRRQQAEARLIARAWQDEAFRQQLVQNPKAAIQQELGVELPAELEVQVVEESPNRVYLRLPVNNTQLSDEQLSAASGGLSGCCSWCD